MPPEVRGDKRAFFDISINEEPVGRIVFSLWNHCCPRTVENFRALCTGELGKMNGHYACYQNSIFHRVIKGFMIQGGDITHKNGQGGYSIYGRTFDDENLALKHKKPYLLSMANRGPDSNGSQFFITTEEVPHLDGKHTVFGEVIKGVDIVKMIENLETDSDDKPLQKVEVTHSGEMVRKGEAVVQEPVGVKDPMEQPTRNWLMRASKSPEPKDGKKKERKRDCDSSRDRRHRRSSRDDRRRRSSRSRSGSRDRSRKNEKRSVTTKDGIKVRGRGKLTFQGTRARSTTPPHWRREESKKMTLEEHQKKMEAEEERKKRAAIREKEETERREREEKERAEREAKRELERQERKKRDEERREKRRYSSPSSKKDENQEPKVEAKSDDSSSSSSESSDSDSD